MDRGHEDARFEFVLLPAPELYLIRPDFDTFSDKFETVGENSVVIFESLGRSRSILVSPTPSSFKRNFAHLKVFIENADIHQRTAFWNAVGKQVFLSQQRENRYARIVPIKMLLFMTQNYRYSPLLFQRFKRI